MIKVTVRVVGDHKGRIETTEFHDRFLSGEDDIKAARKVVEIMSANLRLARNAVQKGESSGQ